MKRTLLPIILVLSIFSSAFATQYDGYYVNNNGDTIKCKIGASSILLQKKELNPLSVTKHLQVKLESGERVKLRPSEIRSFKIMGLETGAAEFKRINNDNDHFYQVWTEGKINLYALYSPHPYDNSPVPHFFAYKNSGELVELKPRNLKKQLGELIMDDKELYNTWITKESQESTLVSMVQLYNSRSIR